MLHLDIKSPNILLSANGTAKIADVGLAQIIQTTYANHSGGALPPELQGTWAWMAPEVIVGEQSKSYCIAW